MPALSLIGAVATLNSEWAGGQQGKVGFIEMPLNGCICRGGLLLDAWDRITPGTCCLWVPVCLPPSNESADSEMSREERD